MSTVGKEAQYQIATGTSITNTQVLNILKAANADSFTFTGKDNNQYVATYSSFDADPAGTGANVQLQVNAYYTVTAVK